MQSGKRRVADTWLGAILGCLVLWCLLRLHSWLPYVSGDLRDFVLPWYQHILAYGRWHSAEASFANYSPPYIYLLCIASLLKGMLSPVAVIKLLDLPFVLLAAGAGFVLCRELGCTRLRAALGAGLIAFLPEICQNCWRWGQCDVIYTSLLLVMRAFLFRRRGYAALIALGVALAFKLQAIFLGPVILALVIAGDVPVLSVLAGIAAYIVMLVPAHLAGRPWRSLMGVYGGQYGYYTQLTMGAPNIFVPFDFITHRFKATVRAGLTDAHLTAFGFLLAVLFAAGLTFYVVRYANLRRGIGLLMSLSLSLIGLPYVLPKMHERYFIAGDTLLAIAAVVQPRLLLPAAMMQTAIVMAYQPFLRGLFPNRDDLPIPFVLATTAIGLLVWEVRRHATGSEQHSSSGGRTAEPGVHAVTRNGLRTSRRYTRRAKSL